MQLNGVTCAACHARSSDQHYNGVVDVVFDPLGPAVAAGTPAPSFDSTAKTCSNIACHTVSAGTYSYYFPGGNGDAVLKTVNIYGNAGGTTPSWYSIGTSCTACHNDPPSNGTDGSNIWHSGYHGGQGPTGPYNQCQLCHPDASSPNNGIGDTITNPLLHGDGTYNVQPAFSSPCFGCH
jgi:predicted CxxxxCH...CXXCH cytochrome family protein